MISFFRRALSSWLALGLLALVLVAFIVTGVRDPFGGSGVAQGALASAGGLSVTEPEFTRVWQRQLEEERRQDPNVTGESLARRGAVEAIVSELASARALEAFGRKQGVRAGNGLVDAEIAAIPAFQTAGRFDQTVYEQALRAQRLTDRELRQGLSGDIIRRQMLTPVSTTGPAPLGVAEPYARLLLERKEGFISYVPAQTVPGVPVPTDAQLQQLYREKRADLTVPEKRSFRYALIDPAQIAARLPVTDAEAQKYYTDHAADYAGLEKRHVLQAAVADQAAGQKLIAASAGGAQFEAAAASVAGLSRADLDIGTLSRADLAKASDPSAAAAVFALGQGQVSAPIQTPFGWRVFKVEGIERTAGRTLAQARPEIEAAVRKTRSEEQATEIANKADKAFKNGANLAEVAKANGLAIVEVPALTATGQGAPPNADAAILKPLLTAAFATDPGEDPTVEDLGGGRAALFALGDVTPPAVPPFDQLKPTLAVLWQQIWKLKRASEIANAVVADVAGGKPLAAALAAHGVQPAKPVAARRIDVMNAQPGTVPPPVTYFLETGTGQTRMFPAPGGAGAFIIQVARSVPADPAQVTLLAQNARRQFGDLQGDELSRQFALAARTAIGAKIDAAAVGRLRARLAGEAAQGQ